jgi:hypothetical protein
MLQVRELDGTLAAALAVSPYRRCEHWSTAVRLSACLSIGAQVTTANIYTYCYNSALLCVCSAAPVPILTAMTLQHNEA